MSVPSNSTCPAVGSSSPESILSKALNQVVYGPRGNLTQYRALNCDVTLADPVAGSQLTCISVPGTGGGLYWTVTVGNQTASELVGPTAYGWPVIASFDGPASTAGKLVHARACVWGGGGVGGGAILRALWGSPA